GDGEGDVVGAVEVLEHLEQRAAERGVAGNVGGERGGEAVDVGGVVVGRGAVGLPVRIGGRVRVAVGVGMLNAGDRAPEVVAEFDVPGGDAGVGHGDVG